MSESLSEFEGVDLYEVLGVSRDEPASGIRKAYLRRALVTHPDKPGGDAAAFRRVSFAHTVLSDESRRAVYDKTGLIDPVEEAKIADLFSKAVRTDITADMIAEDKKNYQGSIQEAEDVKRQYKRYKGDYKLIFESIPHASEDDHQRLITVIRAAIHAGALESTPLFRKTSTNAAIKRMHAQDKKEAAEVEASRVAMGVDTEAGLAALIQSRQKQRFTSLADSLERKYSKPSANKNKSSATKEKAKDRVSKAPKPSKTKKAETS